MTTPTIQVLFICLLFTVFSLSRSEAVSSGNVVTYLPGLAVQPLPFHLETGYIGVGGGSDDTSTDNHTDGGVNQMFYYFVKSERNPKEDPLVLWLTGGPRCSTLDALATAVGPINIDKAVEYNNGSIPTLSLNPYSFTKVANIIFLDEPVGTGFSYSMSSHGSEIGDFLSAKNTYEFLIKWLIQNPEFRSNPLYVSGDSYSGMILPIVVQELIADIEDGKYPFINFKGYTLGNPVTDFQLEKSTKVQFAYNLGLLSYELYQSMRVKCKGELFDFDLSNENCSTDRLVYDNLISGILHDHVTEPICDNTLVISTKAKEMMKNRWRRSLVKTSEHFLAEKHLLPFGCIQEYWKVLTEYWANSDAVQKALNVRKGTVKKWKRCDKKTPYKLGELNSTIEYHQNISSKGYRSLMYSGDHDMTVPHISTEAWIRSLTNMSITDHWRPWFTRKQVAGYTRTYSNGLQYATIKGGGHVAAKYKPEECQAMFERWISNIPL